VRLSTNIFRTSLGPEKRSMTVGPTALAAPPAGTPLNTHGDFR
jgi:hypothetical protein